MIRIRARWLLLASSAALLRCSSSSAPSAPTSDGDTLLPGEVCDKGNPAPLTVHFDPPSVVVAPGQTRPVRAVVDPDLCAPAKATFAFADGSVARGPTGATLDLRHATYDFTVTGGGAANQGGQPTRATTLTVSVQRPGDAAPATATLPIEVRDPAAPACSGESADVTLSANAASASGTGALATATLSTSAAAFTRDDELKLPTFAAQIACAGDLTATAPGKLTALGPAVRFSPMSGISATAALRRELDFAIPVNPAAMPPSARLRHLVVLFQRTPTDPPRPATIASPKLVKVDGKDAWILKFSSPWLGTYQAAVAPDAGTRHFKRHLTHRAVIGISMGGGGAATMGVRHHELFDAIGPLGGPSDWTWLLWYIQTYHVGGFCPASSPGCKLPAPNAYPIDGPFVHTQDFDHWWYQTGSGNGGSFDRGEYTQLFWDLSAMQGNPNGQNADAQLALFPAGPTKSDTWVSGDTTGLPAGADCSLPVDPIKNDPNQQVQQTIQHQCYASRCDPQHAWKAPTGYFDATFNPDGSHQVISFCDGAKDPNAKSPYINTWTQPDPSAAIPFNAALAVDLNKNGVRDADDPIIVQGHEPWDDTGIDGKFDRDEPGYDPITNPDPSHDDYDYAVNPNGTERNHHYDDGEPFEDVGLDGVAGTKQLTEGGFDFGEGDGKLSMSAGARNFYNVDPHGILHGWSQPPAAPLDDAALRRIDAWSDGGVRDLFNFAVVGNHLVGAFASRARADGTPLKSAVFYDQFESLPGVDPSYFRPEDVLWSDVGNVVNLRYGNVDASPQDILNGDGMHVGTGAQILTRVLTSFYFVAHRWPDADRLLTSESSENPEATTVNELGTACEIAGRCEKIFTGPKTGRTGPIAVSLPPGYALEENRVRDVRYPVLFVLHGYGQDPRDLEPAAILYNNRTNASDHSYATRLPKLIVVYVDGRCRVDKDGKPECVRGTFYMNSARPGGPQMEDWFQEVIDYVDKNYRTLGPTDVDDVE